MRIIAIGEGQYSSDNSKWTAGHSVPVVVDYSNGLNASWNASQWDVFFLNLNGNYITDFNIRDWDYDLVYNQIKDLLSE